MRHRRYATLLFIIILVNLATSSLGTAGSAAASQGRAFEIVPPLLSSEVPSNFTISYPVPRPDPLVGQISVLVIAVEFKDYNHTISLDQAANQTIGTLNDYYGRISYGKISVTGNIVGWIRLPYWMSSYGADNGPFVDDQDGDGSPDSWRLLRDAMPSVAQQVNVTAYQQIVVLHAGYGQESSRDTNDIWSVAYEGWATTTSEGVFTKFAVVPEYEASGISTVGANAHEFGHLLGLPDLYNTAAEQVGPWDLMAKGPWNGHGASPAELCAWSRIFLGWITPDHILNVTRQTKVNATLDPIELEPSGLQAIRAQTSSQDSKQYYLVEVRQKIGYDKALPSSGVLITYIDETKSNPVRVIDAIQTTSSLDDAPFQVGQKYIDGANNLIISVTSTDNSSYSVIVDTLAPSVDVAIEGFALNPQIVHPNATASLDIQVANEGTLNAKPFSVAIYLNGTLFASRRISLKSGETQSIQLSWTPKIAGVYVFKAVLDPDNALAENTVENNVETLTAVVGLTLTLGVRAPNGGEDMQWWIAVNGKNETYAGVGDFQIGLLPGANTMQIQSAIYLNPSSRILFRQWSDGSTDNPRTIQASSDMSLAADFDMQYLLSLEPNGGAVSGAGWYEPGTLVTVTATSPSTLVTDQSRLVFLNWSGDAQSDSTSAVVNMTSPHTLKANWKTQYYLKIQSLYTILGAGWYDAASQAVVSLDSPVTTGTGVRYIFVKWSGDLSGASRSETLTMSGPKLVSAEWAPQYALKIESEYGHATGAGWYDASAQVSFGVDTLIIDTGNDTRRVFTQWSGDATGTSQQGTVTMDAPKVIRANWRTQYLISFVTEGVRNGTTLTIVVNSEPHQVKAPEVMDLWVDSGSSISFSSNATLGESFRRYVFKKWQNSTAEDVKSPQDVLKPENYVAVYRELSAFPCIIATVTFGSEVTPEVQLLRGFRDHLVLPTRAGSAFMNAFNSWYYSFSPQVADFVVVHDVLKGPLRIALYPLLGILELSSATYSMFTSVPEISITITGIMTSALIGLVYLTPACLLLTRPLRRKGIGIVSTLRASCTVFLVEIALLVLGELAGSFELLVVTTSALVLTMLLSTPLLFSFALASLERRVGLFEKTRALPLTCSTGP